jgi:hypothetical protein
MGDRRDSVDLADLFGLDGVRVHIGRPLGSAGQGRLYAREGRPGTAVKLFSPAFLFRSAADLRAKLTWMIDHPPVDVLGRYRFAWPRELVVDRGGALAGYTLPAPADGVELRALFVRAREAGPDPRLPDWLVSPAGHRPPSSGRPTVAADWRLLAQAAANLSAATAALHDLGYVIGDFHDGLVRVAGHGGVTLVDCDAMQVTVTDPAPPPADASAGAERVYQAPVGRPEFTPVEVLAERGRPLTPAADDFALAVHCFGLLFGGHRPFSGSWRSGGGEPSRLELARLGRYALAGGGELDPPPGMPPADLLPTDLNALFDRAFGPGAGVRQPRPTAVEWQGALRALSDDLRTCARTRTHHYRPGLAACPWCAREDEARTRAAAVAWAVPPASTATPTAPPALPAPPLPPAPRRPAAAGPAGPRPAGPRHRTPARPASRGWAGQLGAAVLCLIGAALMALTVFSAVDQPSPTEGPSAARPTPAGTARASSPAVAGPAATPAGQSSGPPASYPWLGHWGSVASSSLPGFSLRIDDAGPVGDQEQIVATEPSGHCPVDYRGLVRARPDGPGTYPIDASARLTLDAVLPAGQDPSGCTLLPDPSSYGGSGAEPASLGVIQFQVIAAIDNLAQASVVVHPGQTVNLIMKRL